MSQRLNLYYTDYFFLRTVFHLVEIEIYVQFHNAGRMITSNRLRTGQLEN